MSRTIEVLKRRKWLVIIPLVVVFIIPAVWSSMYMRSYAADSLIWLDSDLSTSVQAAVAGSQRPIQTLADTFDQMLQSRAFVTAVIDKTPLQSAMETPRTRAAAISFFLSNVKAEVVGPNALKVSFSGRSPDEAVAFVSATTGEFLDRVSGASGEQDDPSMALFAQRSDAYRAELASARVEVQAYARRHPEVRLLNVNGVVSTAPRIGVTRAVQREYLALVSKADHAEELSVAYDSSLSDLVKAQALAAAQEQRYIKGLSVVDQPIAPNSFSVGPLLLFDVMALMAAIFIAVTAVVVAELADPTLHTAREAEEVVNAPVLTEVRRSAPPSTSQA